MIRKTFWRSLSAFLTLWLLFTVAAQALADGEGPRLEISADHLPPGMILEVRGVNLGREQQISVSLVGSEGEFQLGLVTSSEVGAFVQSFTLPTDLPPGAYRVLAKVPGEVAVVSALLAVRGAPVMAEAEEGELREEEEPLLAPMPTALKASAAGQNSQPAGNPWLNLTTMAIALGAWVLLAFGLIIIHRSRQTAAHKN